MSRTTPRSFELPPGAEHLPEPEIRSADLGASLDLDKVFGRPGPVEVEVGFGKGRFLLAQAAARPNTLFLGIEYSLPYVRLVRHRVLLHAMANVRLFGGDARDLIARLMPPASLAAVYILFPDPWPKTRHHKRRIVTAAFAADIARALAPHAPLHIVTDNADYAAWIDQALADVPELSPAPRCGIDDLAARTHYAAKLATRGATFHARTWLATR